MEGLGCFGGRGEETGQIDLPAEDQTKREEQVSESRPSVGYLDAGDYHIGESGSEEQEGEDQQEHKGAAFRDCAGGLRVTVEADRVVPAEEDENSHERVPGDFDNDISHDEGLPGVGL